MRYIEAKLFQDVNGKPIQVQFPEEDSEPRNATVPDVLRFSLQAYDLNHIQHTQRGEILGPKETMSYARSMESLKQVADGYVALEDGDFNLVMKVVMWVTPLQNWWKNAHLVQAALDAAPHKNPTPASEPNESDS